MILRAPVHSNNLEKFEMMDLWNFIKSRHNAFTFPLSFNKNLNLYVFQAETKGENFEVSKW